MLILNFVNSFEVISSNPRNVISRRENVEVERQKVAARIRQGRFVAHQDMLLYFLVNQWLFLDC